MAVVDGRQSGRKPVTPQDIAAMPDGPIKSLLLTAPPRHDYPACAVFRGGKCTCDEADNLCPQCGSEEWDRITDRTSPGASFNRCNRCEREWPPGAVNDCMTCAHRDTPGAKGPCKTCTRLWKEENGGCDDNWEPRGEVDHAGKV